MTEMTEELPFCKCGCGERVTRIGNKYINGHNRFGRHHSDESKDKMSAIRRGVLHTSPAQIAADNTRRKQHTTLAQLAADEAKRGILRSPETCAKMAKSHIGVPLSPEHCATLSKVRRGVPKSPEHIAAVKKGLEESGAIERMRGGNDIVNHHYLYDDADLSKFTMPMTRSEHGKMHRRMQLDGYKVSHINSETDDNGLWGYQ